MKLLLLLKEIEGIIYERERERGRKLLLSVYADDGSPAAYGDPGWVMNGRTLLKLRLTHQQFMARDPQRTARMAEREAPRR